VSGKKKQRLTVVTMMAKKEQKIGTMATKELGKIL
jgi:hypothetical protein